MAPPSYAKVLRGNIPKNDPATPPEEDLPPSSGNGTHAPAPPTIGGKPLTKKQIKKINAAPHTAAAVAIASKKEFQQNGFTKSAKIKAAPANNSSRDDFDFVIDAKCDGNANAIDDDDEDGMNENDKNDAINENGKNGNSIHDNARNNNAIHDMTHHTHGNAIPDNQSSDKPIDNGNDSFIVGDNNDKNNGFSNDNSSTDEVENENPMNNNNGIGDGHHDGNGNDESYEHCDTNNFNGDDFHHAINGVSEMLLRMFGNEEKLEKFKDFLKLMELSGGVQLFCHIFDDEDDQHRFASIDPEQQQQLPELSRLPREKLEKTFRNLKRVLIQSYNARIFFPPQQQHQQHFHAGAAEFYPHHHQERIVSIMSAPAAAPLHRIPREIPTQKQIAQRLSSSSAANAAKQQQQQQIQQAAQQQYQYYIDPEQAQAQHHQPQLQQQHQYYHPRGGHQIHQQQQQQHHAFTYPPLPPSHPPTAALASMPPPPQQQQQQQYPGAMAYPQPQHPQQQQHQALQTAATTPAGYPQYLQAAYQHPQPQQLPLVTTTYNSVDFAQYLSHRNISLLDEMRTNQTTLGNLLSSAQC